jgi:hypothetical protein
VHANVRGRPANQRRHMSSAHLKHARRNTHLVLLKPLLQPANDVAMTPVARDSNRHDRAELQRHVSADSSDTQCVTEHSMPHLHTQLALLRSRLGSQPTLTNHVTMSK